MSRPRRGATGTGRIERGLAAVGFLGLTAALGVGCAGTDVGNPMTVSRVEGAALVEAPPSPNALQLPAVELDEVWLGVTSVEMGLSPGCTEGPTAQLPTAFELLSGAELPEAPALEHRAADVLCGVTFRLGALPLPLPEGAPEALRDSSLWLVGRRADGVRLEVRAAFQDTVSLTPAAGAGFTLDHADAILAFAVDRWFASLDLSKLELTGGALLIDEQHNPMALRKLQRALRSSARLLRDEARTGSPTPAAAAAPLAVSDDDEGDDDGSDQETSHRGASDPESGDPESGDPERGDAERGDWGASDRGASDRGASDRGASDRGAGDREMGEDD